MCAINKNLERKQVMHFTQKSNLFKRSCLLPRKKKFRMTAIPAVDAEQKKL